MNDSSVRLFDLLPAQLLRLRGSHGLTINCESGTLWVTQEGVARDVFLFAGQSQSMLPSGVILVESVNGAPARLSLRRQGWRRRKPTKNHSSIVDTAHTCKANLATHKSTLES